MENYTGKQYLFNGGNNNIDSHDTINVGDNQDKDKTVIDAEEVKEAKFEDMPSEALNVTDSSTCSHLSVDDSIKNAILFLIQVHMITTKQDFAAVFKIISEKELRKFTQKEFCRFVSEINDIPKYLLPNENNIKHVYFTHKLHPEWTVAGFTDAKNIHMNDIGFVFLVMFEKMI